MKLKCGEQASSTSFSFKHRFTKFFPKTTFFKISKKNLLKIDQAVIFDKPFNQSLSFSVANQVVTRQDKKWHPGQSFVCACEFHHWSHHYQWLQKRMLRFSALEMRQYVSALRVGREIVIMIFSMRNDYAIQQTKLLSWWLDSFFE